MFAFASQRAYLYLFAALAFGSAVGHYFPLPVELLSADALLIGFILVLLGALWWTWHREPLRYANLPGYLALAGIGMLSVSVAIGLPLTASLRQYAGQGDVSMTGRVTSIPKYQRGHLRFMLTVDSVRQDGPARDATGAVYVYLRAEEAPELFYSDRIRLSAALKEIAPPANRGQFDYRHYLLMRGTVLTAYAVSEYRLKRLDESKPPLWAGLARLRAWLTGSLAHGLPPDLGELAISVVYGDKITDLPEATEERFRRAGLTHILVASGTQISLLIVLLALMCWRLTDDFSWRGLLRNVAHFAATLSIVMVYAAITGFETSIIRALAMGVLVMAGRLLHRQADGLTALAQSGLILLLLNPLSLMSPGFQLSFGATFGLIYVAGAGFPLIAHLTGWRRWAAQTLITTGGAQLFVAPVLAAHFQQLSLWGLASNMLAIPLAFALLIVGGITSLGLSFIPILGDALRLCVWSLAWLLDRTALVFSALPGSNIAVPHPPWWWLAAFYAVVFLAGEWLKARGSLTAPVRRYLRLALPATAAVVVGGIMWWVIVPAPELSALCLPKCEAYIWRPATGRNVLLLRQRGLERQHNADTVASALRYRGINRLHGIIVLDEPGRTEAQQGLAELIPDYSAPVYRPADTVPGDWDMAWLESAAGQASCARLSLGASEIRIVCGKPSSDAPANRADYVVTASPLYDRLTPRERDTLSRLGEQVVVVNGSGALPEDVASCTVEMSIRARPTG